MAGTKISALSAASTLVGTETVPVVQTSTKKATVTQFTTFTTTTLAASAAVDPVAAGDDFLLFRSGVAKLADVGVLATYLGQIIVATGWSDASEADPAVSGDMILADRSGTIYELDVDTIADYAIAALGATAKYETPADLDDLVLVRSGVPGVADIEDIAVYVVATIWDADAITSMLSTDTVYVSRSSVGKQITLANLETQIVTDCKTTILNLDALASATLAAGNKFHVDQSGVAKSVTLTALETKLNTDFATYVAGLTDAATVVDADKFYILNSGTPKYATATELATYVTTEMWAAPTNLGALTGTDTVLTNRTGTMYESTLTEVATFCNASAQATVLNISGLAAATVSAADYMLFCEGTTGKQATVAALAAYVHDDISVYLTSLDAATSLAASDLLYLTQSGTEKKVTLTTLAEYAVETAKTLPWDLISGDKYTALPTSTSTIAMSDTSDFIVGSPIRYKYSSTDFYGIVTAIAANTSITIAGATLSIAQSLTHLYAGTPGQVEQIEFPIVAPYGDEVADLLATIQGQYYKWQKSKAHLVTFSVAHYSPDGGADQPYINVKLNGSVVSTNSSNQGIQLSAVAGTWTDNSAVAINTTNYVIERGESVEIRCTVAGTDGDAMCLTVSCVFVYE